MRAIKLIADVIAATAKEAADEYARVAAQQIKESQTAAPAPEPVAAPVEPAKKPSRARAARRPKAAEEKKAAEENKVPEVASPAAAPAPVPPSAAPADAVKIDDIVPDIDDLDKTTGKQIVRKHVRKSEDEE
jgi:hypothetical protein